MLGRVSVWMGSPRVNHLGTEPGTQAYSAWSCHLLVQVGWNEYLVKAGGANRHIAWYTSPYPLSMVLQCGAGAWLKGLASGEVCFTSMRYTNPHLLYLLSCETRSCWWIFSCVHVVVDISRQLSTWHKTSSSTFHVFAFHLLVRNFVEKEPVMSQELASMTWREPRLWWGNWWMQV